jgi:DNA-binding ferritin-like protein
MSIISPLIRFQEQLRIFHWQTKSYAEHKAFGSAYNALGDLFDKLVEVYSGKYGVPKAKIRYDIVLENYDESINVTSYLDNFISYTEQLKEQLSDAADILNILDEIVAEVNQLKYLLTLK